MSGVGFRDEDTALRSKVDDLERQVAELRAQNARPTAPVSETPAPGISPVRSAVAAGVTALAAAAIASPVLVGGVADSTLAPLLLSLAAVTVLLAGFFLVVSQLLHVVAPNEVLVISGRRTPGPDGATRGYRVARDGRVITMPLIERVQRMSLAPMSLELEVRGVYTRAGDPVDVTATASVRIARAEPCLANAVERFLGRSPNEIGDVARQTLEGALRSVLATVTPLELYAERANAARAVLESAGADFGKLGLEIDTFVIESVEGPDIRG